MDDDQVSVKFGADVAGLTAGTTAANGEIRKVVEAIALLQKSVHTTSQMMTAGLSAALRGAGVQAANTAPQVRKMAEEVQRLSTAGHGGHGTIFGMQSGVFLELRALLDEALAGRMRNFEGSFARLMGLLGPAIQGFVTANPLLAGFGAAAAAAAVGVGVLGLKAYEAQAAVNSLRLDAAVNQFQLSEAAAGQLRDAIEKLANVSASDAAAIAKPFTEMGQVGATVAQMLAPIMKDLAAQMGGDVAKAAEEVAHRFTDLHGAGLAYVNSSRSMTQAEKEHFAELVSSGREAQAYAILIDLTSKSLEALKHSTDTAAAAERDHARAMQIVASAGYSLEEAEQMVGREAEKAAAKISAESGSLTALRSQLLAASTAADTFSAGLATAMKADAVASGIKETQSEIAKIEAALAVAPDHASASVNAMGHALDLLEEKLKELHNQSTDPVLGENKGDLEQYEAAQQLKAAQSRATQQQILQDEIAANREKLKDANLTEKERQQLTLETAQKERQLFDSQTKAATTASRDQLGAARQSIEEQIQLAEEAARKKTKTYDDDLSRHRVSTQEFVAETKASLNEEIAVIQAAYAKELQLAGLTATQKAQLRREEALTVAKVQDQITAAEQKAADASQKMWIDTSNQIQGAFNSQLRELLSGQESWATAGKKILQDFVIQGIEGFEKLAVNFLLQQTVMNTAATTGAALRAAADQTAAAGGIGALIANAVKAIAGSAGQTSAAVSAFMAPVVGPAAPAAGAAAGAAVEATAMGFAVAGADIGMWNVPQNQLTMLHQGELVATPSQADAIRAIPGLLANGGGAAGGGDMHLHYAPSVQVLDARGVASVLQEHGRLFAKEIARQWNGPGMSLRPKY
jgi:hypothetical protein